MWRGFRGKVVKFEYRLQLRKTWKGNHVTIGAIPRVQKKKLPPVMLCFWKGKDTKKCFLGKWGKYKFLLEHFNMIQGNALGALRQSPSLPSWSIRHGTHFDRNINLFSCQVSTLPCNMVCIWMDRMILFIHLQVWKLSSLTERLWTTLVDFWCFINSLWLIDWRQKTIHMVVVPW